MYKRNLCVNLFVCLNYSRIVWTRNLEVHPTIDPFYFQATDFGDEFRLWILAEDREIPSTLTNTCISVVLEVSLIYFYRGF